MRKVPIKYEIYPSVDDLNVFIFGCYNESYLDKMFFKIGTWRIPQAKGLVYADSAAYEQPPMTVSGLGIFEDIIGEVPDLIFSHEMQTIFICDEVLLQIASEKFGRTVLCIKIDYERAFEDVFDFESSLMSVMKEAK